jgi:hypothetical protein
MARPNGNTTGVSILATELEQIPVDFTHSLHA